MTVLQRAAEEIAAQVLALQLEDIQEAMQSDAAGEELTEEFGDITAIVELIALIIEMLQDKCKRRARAVARAAKAPTFLQRVRLNAVVLRTSSAMGAREHTGAIVWSMLNYGARKSEDELVAVLEAATGDGNLLI